MEKRVLYVKDSRSFFSRSICGIVSQIFAGGWEIDVVKSPSAALGLLENKSYQVVICDFNFGKREINGVDFLFRVREVNRDTETILVVGEFYRQSPTLKIDELKIGLAVDFFWKKIGRSEKIRKRGEQILAQLFQKNKRINAAGVFHLPEDRGSCVSGCPCCQRRDGHA
ncbi:MAG: hypothetical protein WC848_06370 [Parcubacteria group bacterium]|jgi:DNA-binding NtrC family response regulator